MSRGRLVPRVCGQPADVWLRWPHALGAVCGHHARTLGQARGLRLPRGWGLCLRAGVLFSETGVRSIGGLRRREPRAMLRGPRDFHGLQRVGDPGDVREKEEGALVQGGTLSARRCRGRCRTGSHCAIAPAAPWHLPAKRRAFPFSAIPAFISDVPWRRAGRSERAGGAVSGENATEKPGERLVAPRTSSHLGSSPAAIGEPPAQGLRLHHSRRGRRSSRSERRPRRCADDPTRVGLRCSPLGRRSRVGLDARA